MAINETRETKKQQIRDAAEADFLTFVRLVFPKQLIGSVHEELANWWTRQDAKTHQLTLLPRDHGKSRWVAFRVAWEITRRPWIRVLYISATANLAEKQLGFIKQILTSPIYRRYWPEMVNEEEGKRAKWTNSEIEVDHPKRLEEGIRDPTVFTGGLTTSLTGLHCDIAVLDDVVVFENAYTEEGRNKVFSQYSLLSSIEGADAQEWCVGTRYHPKDLYGKMLEMVEEVIDEDGEVAHSEQIYEVFERAVEDAGDGSGQFLWPRQQRADGMWFGFDSKILAKKRGKYLDRTQFRAQYYNDPNDPGELRIERNKFQYYKKEKLVEANGTWYYGEHKLNIFAAVDFAYTVSKRSDYTAIVVIGIDRYNNIYVLDIDRFKTTRISDYFDRLMTLHTRWGFRKLAAETTAAQISIVTQLKDLIRENGLYVSIAEIKHTKHEGTKEERMSAILEPRYDNLAVWHYRGGNCQILEDELIMQHPPHDDVMDALATAIDIAVPPTGIMGRDRMRTSASVLTHPRFGGVRYA